MTQTRTFRVFRSAPATGEPARYQEYEVETPPGTTVLDGLRAIQAEQDGSLSFRSACRGAVCGSCAMSVNGRVDLACRVQVASLPEGPVTVEPLPFHTVEKDLVVAMEPLFKSLKHMKTWLTPAERAGTVAPSAWAEAESYANCILCSSCNAVCPVVERDSGYLGPAVLARTYRFVADPRDGALEERLGMVDDDKGVWGCDMVWACVKACPKGVEPTRSIGKMRVMLKKKGREDGLKEQP